MRLAAERERILSLIKDLEPQAQESDRLRAEIADLKAQRRMAEQRVREIQHEIAMLEINKAAQETDICSNYPTTYPQKLYTYASLAQFTYRFN